jgi:GNAT superfamily N-acetyltransferase
MRIRQAKLDDLDLLVRHRRGMFEDMGGHAARDLDEADPVYRRWARSRLRSGSLVAFVAEEKGRALGSGCVWVQPVQPRPGRPEATRAYLLSMFTERDARGRGVATAIVKKAMAWSKREGFPRLVLHASKMGQPVYEKLGFRPGREMYVEF